MCIPNTCGTNRSFEAIPGSNQTLPGGSSGANVIVILSKTHPVQSLSNLRAGRGAGHADDNSFRSKFEQVLRDNHWSAAKHLTDPPWVNLNDLTGTSIMLSQRAAETTTRWTVAPKDVAGMGRQKVLNEVKGFTPGEGIKLISRVRARNSVRRVPPREQFLRDDPDVLTLGQYPEDQIVIFGPAVFLIAEVLKG